MTPTQAKQLCIEAHKGQVRYDGSPYSSHPIAVADTLHSEDEKIVAYLHDIFEDTSAILRAELGYCEFKGNKFKLSIPQAKALFLLTHRKEQDYFSYIRDIKFSYLAVTVKIADILHNLSSNPKESSIIKYNKALNMLIKKKAIMLSSHN